MKKLITIISCFLFVACSHDENNQSTVDALDSLSVSEIKGYAYYSKSENRWRKEIEGKMMNSAKVNAYKDFIVEINFFSRTHTLLKTKQYTIYESMRPFDKKRFYTSEFNCDDLDKDVDYNLEWKLIGATSFVPNKD